MQYRFIDSIHQCSREKVTAFMHLRGDESFLVDHFPSFPVLPGVLILETMVQAARVLLEQHTDEPLVLGTVRALTYGAMVRPGEIIQVDISLNESVTGEEYSCRGQVRMAESMETGNAPGETAASGRFTMRNIRDS